MDDRDTYPGSIREAQIRILKTAPHDLCVLAQMVDEKKAMRKYLHETIDLQGVDTEIETLEWLIDTINECATRESERALKDR